MGSAVRPLTPSEDSSARSCIAPRHQCLFHRLREQYGSRDSVVASVTGSLVGLGLLVTRLLRQKHIVEGEISSLRHIGRSRRTARCR
jgi:hypothetical protein